MQSMNKVIFVIPVAFDFQGQAVTINCVRPMHLSHPIVPGMQVRLFSDCQQETAIAKAENIFTNFDGTVFLYVDNLEPLVIEDWQDLVSLAHHEHWIPCVFLPGIGRKSGVVYWMAYDDIVAGYTLAMDETLSIRQQEADEGENAGALFAELGQRVLRGEMGRLELIGMEGDDVFY